MTILTAYPLPSRKSALGYVLKLETKRDSMNKSEVIDAIELVKKFIESKLPSALDTIDSEGIEKEFDYVEATNLLQRLKDNY